LVVATKSSNVRAAALVIFGRAASTASRRFRPSQNRASGKLSSNGNIPLSYLAAYVKHFFLSDHMT